MNNIHQATCAELLGVSETEWTVRIKFTVRFISSARLRAKTEHYCQAVISLKVLHIDNKHRTISEKIITLCFNIFKE